VASSSDSESGGSFDVTSVRDAAKWLLTAFAAVGAALLGGVQFSQVGEIGGYALAAAVAGFGLGLLGVGIAIGWTSTVLVTRTVSVAAMQRDPEVGPFLQSNRDIVGLEFASFEAFVHAREAAWDEWNIGRSAGLSDADWKELSTQRRNRLDHLEQVATRVARIWRFEKVCRAFTTARRAAFLGAAVAAVGILMFTCAKKFTSAPSFPKNPTAVAVTYTFNAEAYQSLLKQAPEGCLLQAGAATLLDGWPGGTDLLISPTSAKCPPLRLRWGGELGVLKAADPSAKSP
jgi:hypothetical protein